MNYVIKSIERLQSSNVSKIHYIILGDGNDRPYFEELISDSSVNDKIYLLGSVKDVRPYYAISDLFLLLSSGEGFPNTLLEAWAMELPVVVSNHHPYPEITNSNNAFMLSLDDENGLDDIIKELTNNKNKFKEVGIKNRNNLKSDYLWRNIASRYIKNINFSFKTEI